MDNLFGNPMLSNASLKKVNAYIVEHYIFMPSGICVSEPLTETYEVRINNLINNLDDSFSVTLMQYVGASGKKDSEIYKLANVDRRLFSKIKNNTEYIPAKQTALAFAIALELDYEQTVDLLKRAGFALSHSCKSDVIVEYFIKNEFYNMHAINEALYIYSEPLLGGKV